MIQLAMKKEEAKVIEEKQYHTLMQGLELREHHYIMQSNLHEANSCG